MCCNVRSVRLMRSMLLCCALWSCGVTLSTRVLPKETPEAEGVSFDIASHLEEEVSDEASRESLGMTFTEAEEKDRIRQVVRLLYSGGDIDEAVREGVESGSIDRKTLAVLHRKVRTETERSSGESGVEGVEVGDDGIGGGAALRRRRVAGERAVES